MRSKKSNVFCFLCSFFPGAAEMYMGFMKMGVSLMALFFLCFIIPTVLGSSNVFVLVSVLVWFFGFFHARNLAACSDEELSLREDVFIWEELGYTEQLKMKKKSVNKWIAVLLIFCGACMIWNNVWDIMYQFLPSEYFDYVWTVMDRIPRIAVAIVIIVIGVRMIMGKKEELEDEIPEEEIPEIRILQEEALEDTKDEKQDM